MGRPLILAGLLILVATGCGFHLRTWDLEGSVETALVNASGRNSLAEPLRRALRSAGVALVETDGDADIVVDLLDERRGRRTLSVTDRARAAQYEVSLRVSYQVRRGGSSGAMLVEPRWVQASRIYRVDRNNLVGSSEEQALLEREMVTDLVQRVIRSLNAASTTGAA